MKILHATIENFKRIVVVELRPPADVIEVTGANKQGKSSLLDGIEWVLRGKRGDHAPAEPIRRGAERVRGVLDLGDLIVERVETKSSDRLVVRGKDGGNVTKAQARLDELVGGLAFDALGFMTMKPQDQRQTLLRVLGVDLDGFDARRQEIYDRRTQTGRDLAAARARLEAAPAVEAPDEEVVMADLLAELSRAMEQRAENERVRERARQAAEEEREALVQSERWKAKCDELEAQLAAAREQLVRATTFASGKGLVARGAKKDAAALVDPALEPIQQRLAAAGEVNAGVRAKKARAELAAAVVRFANAQAADTARLEGIDEEKAEALAAASMPVEGLAVAEDGVTFGGLPLAQASQSEQIRVCTAIGAALNPALRIALVRHGNDLDSASLAAFYEECRRHDLQAWVERIEGITGNAIVIEEGRVAG